MNNIWSQKRQEIANLANILFLDIAKKIKETMLVILSVFIGIISRLVRDVGNFDVKIVRTGKKLSWTMLSEDQNNPMKNPCQIGHSGYDLFLCTMIIGEITEFGVSVVGKLQAVQLNEYPHNAKLCLTNISEMDGLQHLLGQQQGSQSNFGFGRRYSAYDYSKNRT